MLRLFLAAMHLIALGIGLGAVWARANALSRPLDRAAMVRAFRADTWWGIAAALWVVTGLLRAFAGLEKGSQFYLASPLFWTKMALFAAVILLEIWPMATFIRWRTQLRRGQIPETSRARALYLVNHVEMALVVLIVFVASFMARGFGIR